MIDKKDKLKLQENITRSLYKTEFILYYIELYFKKTFDLIDFIQSINSVGGDLLEELDYSEPNLEKICILAIRSYGLSSEETSNYIKKIEPELKELIGILKKDYEDLFKELYELKPDYTLEIPQITEKLIK